MFRLGFRPVPLLVLSLVALICVSLAAAAAPESGRAEPNKVSTRLATWHDADRERNVPVKLYLPKQAEGRWPIVLFSHGLGGSREAANYLGRYWAGHGYAAVFLQHRGSDRSVWANTPRPQRLAAMKRAMRNPRNAIARVRDVHFAIDRLIELNEEDDVLRGRLNTDRIAIAGHSFGAWTALAVAGRTFITPRGRHRQFDDPRVKAAIVMSGQPARKPEHNEPAFSTIDIPCLHMTGTLDEAMIGDTTAKERRIPFDHTPGPDQGGADQYLLILDGGDHQVFSGRRWRPSKADPAKDPRFHRLIQSASAAFLDAYVQNDAEARAWLKQDGFTKGFGGDGTFEMK
jgi:predicted dienelactone hydrolase